MLGALPSPPVVQGVRHIDGTPIPNNWPSPKVNGKVRTSAAVETARATIREKAIGTKTQPIVFAECNEAPKPPAHLRDGMPEHGDEANYAAQAALRAVDPEPINPTVQPSDYHQGGPRLNAIELKSIADLYTEKFGAILSLDQAAQITKLSKQTLRRFVCEGKFAASVFRGRPLRFITQRLLEEVLT